MKFLSGYNITIVVQWGEFLAKVEGPPPPPPHPLSRKTLGRIQL